MEEKKIELDYELIRERAIAQIERTNQFVYHHWLVHEYMTQHPDFDMEDVDSREALIAAQEAALIEQAQLSGRFDDLDDEALRKTLQIEEVGTEVLRLYLETYAMGKCASLFKQCKCTCLSPYRDWGNGIKGAVLAVDHTHWFKVYLIDNPAREEGKPGWKSYDVSSYERRLMANCEDLSYEMEESENLRGMYDKYHIVPIGNVLVQYLLFDLSNVSKDDISTARRREMDLWFKLKKFHSAISSRCEDNKAAISLRELEEIGHGEDDWRHKIVQQILREYRATNAVNIAWRDARKESLLHCAELVERSSTAEQARIGQILTDSKKKNPDTYQWWWVVESFEKNKKNDKGLDYSKYSVQEVIAFVAHAKYLYMHPSMNNIVAIEEVTMEERMDIFYDYLENNIDIAKRSLKAKNDPLRTALPSREEAIQQALCTIADNSGRIPEWVPENMRPTYFQYEQAFHQYSAEQYPQEVIQPKVTIKRHPVLPHVLIPTLNKFVKKGLLTVDYQPTESNWGYYAVMIAMIYEHHGISRIQWSIFERLWNHRGLRSNYDGAMNKCSRGGDYCVEIKQIIKKRLNE